MPNAVENLKEKVVRLMQCVKCKSYGVVSSRHYPNSTNAHSLNW